MKKKLFSAATATALCFAAPQSANAALVSASDLLFTFLQITDFTPPIRAGKTGNFNIEFSSISTLKGGPITLTIADSQITPADGAVQLMDYHSSDYPAWSASTWSWGKSVDKPTVIGVINELRKLCDVIVARISRLRHEIDALQAQLDQLELDFPGVHMAEKDELIRQIRDKQRERADSIDQYMKCQDDLSLLLGLVSSPPMSFKGNLTVDAPGAGVELAFAPAPPVAPKVAKIAAPTPPFVIDVDYSGLASIFGIDAPIDGHLAMNINLGPDSMNIAATETCRSGTCLEQVLWLLDQGTADPGVMHGVLIPASLMVPEPENWALLGLGLLSLGYARRTRAHQMEATTGG